MQDGGFHAGMFRAIDTGCKIFICARSSSGRIRAPLRRGALKACAKS
jgi:hypothetical protein